MLLQLAALLVVFGCAIAHESQTTPPQTGQHPPQVNHEQQGQDQQNAQQTGAQQDNKPMQEFGGESAKDEEHIKQHLHGKIDAEDIKILKQLNFHYFNMQDLDKNGKIDGVELIKSITHNHDDEGARHQDSGHSPRFLYDELMLESQVDLILHLNDFNGDGCIEYGEFVKQKSKEKKAKVHQEQMAAQAAGHQQNPPPQQRH